jgi:calmodulin
VLCAEDGFINLEEFQTMLAPHLREPNDNDIEEIFRVFDADHDNYISRDDLKKALSNIGNEPSNDDLDDMMREADKDGDGKISLEGMLTVDGGTLQACRI